MEICFILRVENFFLKMFGSIYFSKIKNIYVWDLDGRKYLDFCHMGVGTNIFSDIQILTLIIKLKKLFPKEICPH